MRTSEPVKDAKDAAPGKTPEVSVDEFLDLLAGDFRRLGVSVSVSGKPSLSRRSVRRVVQMVFDSVVAAVAAGERLTISGVGRFWVARGVVKFRGGSRYRKAVSMLSSGPEASARERYESLKALLSVMDAASQGQGHKRVIEWLASMM